MLGEPLFQFVFFGLLYLIVVAQGFVAQGFTVSDHDVARWATSAGLALTDENRRVARRYLTWNRRSRRLGVLAGFLLYNILFGLPNNRFNPFPLPYVWTGYVLGALLAEVVINRPQRRSGAALLVPRRLDHYLPGYVLVLQRGLPVVAVLLVGGFALTPFPDLPTSLNINPHTVAGFAVWAVLAVGTAVVIEALQRLIVARRQPLSSPDDLAVDDAIRSSSLHVLAGAALALLFLAVGAEVGVIMAFMEATRLPFPFAWLPLAGLTLLLYLLSVYSWLRVGTRRGFRVRRSQRYEAPA
jgi:hypothetical protein